MLPFLGALGGVKGVIMGGLAILLLVGGGAFYLYYQSSQNTIQSLYEDLGTSRANEQRVKDEIVGLNESIRILEHQRTEDQRKILVVQDEARVARLEVEKLRAIFKEHDLDRLSKAKPGLIENIINRGTKKVFDDFEDLTKLPKKEGATSPSSASDNK